MCNISLSPRNAAAAALTPPTEENASEIHLQGEANQNYIDHKRRNYALGLSISAHLKVCARQGWRDCRKSSGLCSELGHRAMNVSSPRGPAEEEPQEPLRAGSQLLMSITFKTLPPPQRDQREPQNRGETCWG